MAKLAQARKALAEVERLREENARLRAQVERLKPKPTKAAAK